jgi:hypothetical protein
MAKYMEFYPGVSQRLNATYQWQHLVGVMNYQA